MNELVNVRAPGVLVRGPFDPARAVQVSGRLEEGALRVALACENELAGMKGAIAQDGHVGLERVIAAVTAGKPSATVSSTLATSTLPVPACRWVAIIWAESAARGALVLAQGG